MRCRRTGFLPQSGTGNDRRIEWIPLPNDTSTPISRSRTGRGTIVIWRLPEDHVQVSSSAKHLRADVPENVPHCNAESFAVILSAAKDLALPAQDKLREESRPGLFRRQTAGRARCSGTAGRDPALRDSERALSRTSQRRPFAFNGSIGPASRRFSSCRPAPAGAFHHSLLSWARRVGR